MHRFDADKSYLLPQVKMISSGRFPSSAAAGASA
jgi:hypothetical protein